MLIIFSFLFFMLLASSLFANKENEFSSSNELNETEYPVCWNGVRNFARICYYFNSPNDGEEEMRYRPQNIHTDLCTHIIYTNSFLDELLYKMVTSDGNGIEFKEDLYKEITYLKEAGVRILMSIGGRPEYVETYSEMIKNPKFRAHLVTKITECLTKYGFQGLDLHTGFAQTFPESEGAELDGKKNFIILIHALKNEFEREKFSTTPSLSVIVTGRKKIADMGSGYDIPIIAQNADWITLVPYNMNKLNDVQTSLEAPFSVHPGDDEEERKTNVQSLMNLWLQRGVPANKLVLGIAFFGNVFQLASESDKSLNAPIREFATPIEKIRNRLQISFREILENVSNKGWKAVHNNYLGSYAYQDRLWVSYDDAFDVAVKAEYARMNCFFGVAGWSLNLECSQEDCPGGRYALLSTIKNILTGTLQYRQVKNIT